MHGGQPRASLSVACGLWPVAAGVTKHSRPEPLYFWGYFVLMNFIWIVVPGMCLVYCITNINRSVAANKALVPAA